MPAGGRLALLGAPLRSSLVTKGTEASASQLRAFAVSAAGISGVDFEDGGEVSLPAPGETDFLAGGPVPKNESRVRESLLTLAGRISEPVRRGSVPVVFGGDATVLLGVLAGLLDGREAGVRTGLVSLDGFARFRTPEDQPAGDLSLMALALATGHGPVSMTHLARDRFPLVQEPDVLLAGVRDADPKEADSLIRSRVTVLTPDQLQGTEGVATFMGALGRMTQRTHEIVFHLDASALDPALFPVASGTPSAGGLSSERIRTLGGELSTWDEAGTIRIAAASVSGVDARKDVGGVRMHELAGFMLRLFGRRGGVAP